MIYSRIDLEKTNYKTNLDWKKLNLWPPHSDLNFDTLNSIYTKYCRYKNFKSVMPIFDSEYIDMANDVIGYYHNRKLVAFSIIRKHNPQNAEAIQFAWDYENPKLKLGIESLKHECAFYKDKGYKYLYLGEAAEYKKIDGYEELGPL